jgi:hypothetical protein
MTPSQSIRVRITAGFVLSIICAMLCGSCDESLPARDEPVDFLLISCSMDYYQSRSGFGINENIYFTIRITNNYTEVFSDTASVYGTLEFTKTDDPAFQKHIDLTVADLKQSYFNPATGQTVASRAEYNAASKILTIPIGQSAIIQYKWDLQSDNLTDLRRVVKYSPDASNPSILRTGDLPFMVTSGVKVYKKFPMLYLQPVVKAVRLFRVL